MRASQEIIGLLLQPGIIAVVRAKSAAQLSPLAEALVAGGVLAVEITLTTPNALEGIRALRDQLGSRALVGVGSVVNRRQCEEALAAGAEFVVSPITKPEIAQTAKAAQKPVMLGAYTPTEAQLAYESGADFVKLFPADNLGPSYIKALHAPLPHLRFVPTGGVDLSNVKDFLEAGAAAVGVGSALIAKSFLDQQDWSGLTKRAAEYVAAATSAQRPR